MSEATPRDHGMFDAELSGAVLNMHLLGRLMRWLVPYRLSLIVSTILVLIAAGFGTTGYSWQDGLLLFEGSALKYTGFVAEMSYRKIGLPIFALAAILIHRNRKARV